MFEPVSGSPAVGVTPGPAGGICPGGSVPPGVTEPGMVVLGPATVVVGPGAGTVVVGAWTGLTVIVNVPDAETWLLSLAVQVTVVTPRG